MIKIRVLPLFFTKNPVHAGGILDNGWEIMAKRHENDLRLCCALLPLVLLLGWAEARDVRVEGRAVYADGAPVSGGVIVFTDLVGRPFSMPKTRRLAEVVTTEDGGFSVELKEVEGDVDVNLMRRECAWQGAVVMLTDRESVGGKIVLTTKRESCGSSEGDKALEE